MQILKVIREKGWTLERVAKEMGIQKGTLSDSISKMPNVRRLIDIANIIGCSPADFFADWATAEENLHRSVECRVESVEFATAQQEAEPANEAPDASGLPFGGEAAAPLSVGGDSIATQATKADGGAAAMPQGTPPAGATLQAALVCPHCHHAIAVTLAGAG